MGERVFIILILIVPAKLSLSKAAQFTLLLTVNKKFCFLTVDVMKIYNICQSGGKHKLNVVSICISLIIIEVEHIFWCMWPFALLFLSTVSSNSFLNFKLGLLCLCPYASLCEAFFCCIFGRYFLLIVSLSLGTVLPPFLGKELFIFMW